MVLGGDRITSKLWLFFRLARMNEAKPFRTIPLSLMGRRAIDAGVWKGNSYEGVPAATIPM